MNLNNLKLLRDWLEENESRIEFNMSFYRSDYECKTSGCALGWATRVPGLEPILSDQKNDGGFNFERYAERLFTKSLYLGIYPFLFDSFWSKECNTIKDFIKRADLVLQDKNIVDQWTGKFTKIEVDRLEKYLSES